MIEEQKQRALIAIDLARDDLIQLSHKIHDHGEIAYEEHQSAALLEQYLKSKGFDIESGIGGLPTAFIGMMQGKSSERIIALLAEYDALPKIGHGCGHNLIAAGAIGAAIGIAEVISELPGVVKVIGTPAEEYAGGKSGKIILLEKGVFSDIGISLMFHPWTRSGVPKSDLHFMENLPMLPGIRGVVGMRWMLLCSRIPM
jgi:amidohydrolase